MMIKQILRKVCIIMLCYWFTLSLKGDDGPSDDGPSDDGPSDDGPSDDGPSDDGPSDGKLNQNKAYI